MQSPVAVKPYEPAIVLPNDFQFPRDGVHIREPDPWTEQELRQRRVRFQRRKLLGAQTGSIA